LRRPSPAIAAERHSQRRARPSCWYCSKRAVNGQTVAMPGGRSSAPTRRRCTWFSSLTTAVRGSRTTSAIGAQPFASRADPSKTSCLQPASELASGPTVRAVALVTKRHSPGAPRGECRSSSIGGQIEVVRVLRRVGEVQSRRRRGARAPLARRRLFEPDCTRATKGNCVGIGGSSAIGWGAPGVGAGFRGRGDRVTRLLGVCGLLLRACSLRVRRGLGRRKEGLRRVVEVRSQTVGDGCGALGAASLELGSFDRGSRASR
jgi:hypothetical protein